VTDRFDFLKKGYEEALEEIALGAELVRALRHGPSLEKKADGEESSSRLEDLANQARSYNAVNYGLLGAGAGAGVGILRSLTSKKKRQLLRDALTGALAGGAIGAGAGGLTDALGQGKKDDKPPTPEPLGTRPVSGPQEAGRLQRLTTDFLHRSGSNPADVQQAVRRHTENWHAASARAAALERAGRQDEARALREQASTDYRAGLESVRADVERNRSETGSLGRAHRAFTSPGLGYSEAAQEGLAELDPGLKHALPWTDAFERSHQTPGDMRAYAAAGGLAAASGAGAYGLMRRRQNTSLLREALQGQLRTQGPVKDQLTALSTASPALEPVLTGLAGHTGQMRRSWLGGRVGSSAMPNGPSLSRPQTSALLGAARTANNQLGRPVGPSRRATIAGVGAGAALPLLGYGLYRRFNSPDDWNTGRPAVEDQAAIMNRIVAEQGAQGNSP
jgi:hypothetical protein